MRIVRVILVLAAVAAAFVAGRWYSARPAGPGKVQDRKILYWVDPMHPAYKSDKPGIAPDCGMKLEPVYADAPPPAAAGQHSADASTMPPGTVQVSAERQQLIGVKYGTAEQAPAGEVIRVVGKVAIDETRVSHVHSPHRGLDREGPRRLRGRPGETGAADAHRLQPRAACHTTGVPARDQSRAAMRHSSMAGGGGRQRCARLRGPAPAAALGHERFADRRSREHREADRERHALCTCLGVRHHAQCLRESAGDARHRALHRRGPLPHLGARERFRIPDALPPRGPAGHRVSAVCRRQNLQRAGRLHTAAGGRGDAHRAGASRTLQPRPHAQARDVRQRGASFAAAGPPQCALRKR